MNGYFSDAGVFLISVIFGFFILLVMLRFLLQTVRADFHNPLSQFVYKVTNPALMPFRKVIPGFGGIDIAALVLLLVLQVVELLLVHMITNQSLHPIILLIVSFEKILSLMLWVFIIAILIQVIMSWIQTGGYNPMITILYQLTEPLLRPIRRRLPPVSGIDFSPLIALVVLNLLVMAVPYLRNGLLSMLL